MIFNSECITKQIEDWGKNYFTIKDITELVQLSYLTIFRLIKKGEINAKKVKDGYLVSKNDLNQFLQSAANINIED